VDLPNTALNGLSNVTVAGWIRSTKTGQQAIISGANSGNDNEYLIFLLSDTVLRLYGGGGSVQWTISSLADGGWHHLAMVRDADNNQATLYIDGNSQGVRPKVFGALSIEVGGLVLGQEQDSVGGGFQASQAFSGDIDEFRVYSRVLTGPEITGLAQ